MTAAPEKAEGNVYMYKLIPKLSTATDEELLASVTYDADVSTAAGYTAWDGEAMISSGPSGRIILVEATADYKARAVGLAKMIGQLHFYADPDSETTPTSVTVRMQTTKKTDNVYKYKVTETDTIIELGQNVQNWSAWDGTSAIPYNDNNKTLHIVEASPDYKAEAWGFWPD